MSAEKLCKSQVSPARRSREKFRGSFSKRLKKRISDHRRIMQRCKAAANQRARAPSKVPSETPLEQVILELKQSVETMKQDMSQLKQQLQTFTSKFGNIVTQAVQNEPVDIIRHKLAELKDVTLMTAPNTSEIVDIERGNKLFNAAKESIIGKDENIYIDGELTTQQRVADELETIHLKLKDYSLNESEKDMNNNFKNMNILLKALQYVEPVVHMDSWFPPYGVLQQEDALQQVSKSARHVAQVGSMLTDPENSPNWLSRLWSVVQAPHAMQSLSG